jgi:hypothetical protein
METVINLLESIITKKLKLKKISKKIQEECMKELSTFIFPKINSDEDIAILIEEMKNYCERYFTYYAILYLTKKNQYNKTQEEMLVYKCMIKLYDVPENHQVLIDYMALLYFESKNSIKFYVNVKKNVKK